MASSAPAASLANSGELSTPWMMLVTCVKSSELMPACCALVVAVLKNCPNKSRPRWAMNSRIVPTWCDYLPFCLGAACRALDHQLTHGRGDGRGDACGDAGDQRLKRPGEAGDDCCMDYRV